MALATLTGEGQVAIPKPVRDGLGISTGDRIEFIEIVPGRYEVPAATRDVSELKGIVGTARKAPETVGRWFMRFFEITAALALTLGSTPTWALDAYDQTLTLQGVTFRVQCDNAASENTLMVSPSGLEIDNAPIRGEVDGVVTGAEIADLNADGSPELYVYLTSAGSGSYGSLAAWSANNKKSLSAIHLPELAEDPVGGKGYMGHDKFVAAEQYLVRSFPVYRDGDSNAAPSGGTRQIQYKLEPGEAAWQLVVEKTVNFE